MSKLNRLYSILILLFLAGLLISACSGKKDENEAKPNPGVKHQADNPQTKTSTGPQSAKPENADKSAWGEALQQTEQDIKKSKNDKMMRTSALMQQALLNGDAAKARNIWLQTEDQLTKGVIQGTTALTLSNPKLLQSMLAHIGYEKFTDIADFFSSIEQGTLSVNAQESAKTATVEGRITDTNTRKQVAGVTVILGGQRAVSDAKGNYKFDAISPGTYAEFALKPGIDTPYFSSMVEVYDGRSEVIQLTIEAAPVAEVPP